MELSLSANELKDITLLEETASSELWLAKLYAESVVIKRSKWSMPGMSHAEMLRHEFDHCRQFPDAKLMAVKGLFSWNDTPVLLREYFEGQPLDRWLANHSFTEDRFLRLAVALVEAVRSIHDAGCIHGRLSPEHLLLSSDSADFRLLGLRAPSGHDGGTQRPYQALRDDPYQAPEQHPRSGAPVDERSDIYALGALFWLMLTGQAPVLDKQAAGASSYADLQHLCPELAPVVIRIVEKMMATDQRRRYQTLAAVAVDLQICLGRREVEVPQADFQIDRLGDVRRLFSQGEHHGREVPLQRLVDALEQAVGQPLTMVLVHGTSGIGKSSLVYAAQLSMVGRYHFVQAKFDQYVSNSPFQGLFAALQQLLRQLLSESSEQVRRWGALFHEALGSDAGILVETLPELTWFIGEPPEAVALPAEDAKVRLQRLLSRFVQTLASLDLPLCLFLDDCQWADAATLEWLESVRHDLRSVVVVMAFRDDADSMNKTLSGFLARLEEQDTGLLDLPLEPLGASLIGDVLQKRLELSSEEAEALAVTIVEKTQGNPLYVSEYLRQCQLQGVLRFDPVALAWRLDLQQLQHIPASENVVQLLAGRLTFLLREGQQVLKTAACIGNQFGVDLLKQLLPDVAVEPLLADAQADGWLVPRVAESKEYAFTHDRIQQAAYGLMDEQTAQRVHLSIAQCLMEGQPPEAHLMECVHHYNVALSHIVDTQLLAQVGQLNLQASEVAKKNGDFQLALEHVKQAMALLLPRETDPLRHAEILKERAECEHLCGRKSAALSHYHQALDTSVDARQRTRIYELLIKFYTDCNEFQQAFDTGREALAHLGFRLPAGFHPLNFAADYVHLKRKLLGATIETLLAIPEASDAAVCDQIRLLSAMQKAAYQLRPELCVALAAKQVGLCLRHGNTREAVVGYMVFGVIFLGGIRGIAEEGEKYGRLSMAMLEHYNNQMQSAEVPFVYGYFAHSWVHPASDTERLWMRAYERGLDIGDWFHVGCAAAAILQSQLMRGQPLEPLLHRCDDFLATLQRIDARQHVHVLVGIRQAILNLRSPSSTLPDFSHDDFDESAYVSALSQSSLRHLAHMYFVNKMWVLYFHGHYEEAAAVAVISQGYMKDSQGMLHAAEHCFVHALVLAQTLRTGGRLGRRRHHLRIKGYEEKLHRWAKQCPDNFLARAQLLQGERYRLSGCVGKAIACFQEACTTAQFYGQLNLQIVGHQLLEQLYARQTQRVAAQSHRLEKEQLAERWGVNSRYAKGDGFRFANQSGQFDLDGLSSAVEVISQERQLPRLLETLMTILQENTLARRCVLMLRDNQQFLIQAEVSVDGDAIQVMQNLPYDQACDLPLRVINYVIATQAPILLDDACRYAVFSNESYFTRYRVLSVLCVPLMIQGEVKGIVYLENDSAAGVFTEDRFALLRYLGGQIAISIENALVYQKLEQKVGERTQDIERQKQALQKQNDTIVHLNQRLTKENGERKLAEQKLKDANRRLQMLATTDGLTGISNRRHFNDVLQRQHLYCKRHERPLALLICDLDEFKAYNDHYGHQAGDECLMAVAECLASVVKRPDDLVARYGGEEFAVILPDTDRDGALSIAERIHQAIGAGAIPHQVSSVASRVTLSMGLSVGYQVDVVELLSRADQALYRAKGLGKNRTCVFDADD